MKISLVISPVTWHGSYVLQSPSTKFHNPNINYKLPGLVKDKNCHQSTWHDSLVQHSPSTKFPTRISTTNYPGWPRTKTATKAPGTAAMYYTAQAPSKFPNPDINYKLSGLSKENNCHQS